MSSSEPPEPDSPSSFALSAALMRPAALAVATSFAANSDFSPDRNSPSRPLSMRSFRSFIGAAYANIALMSSTEASETSAFAT